MISEHTKTQNVLSNDPTAPEFTPDTKMKCVVHLFTPVVSPEITFQRYLWHLNIAKLISVSPTELGVAQIFSILRFNKEYFKGELLFACRMNFLPIFHALPTVHERAKVS